MLFDEIKEIIVDSLSVDETLVTLDASLKEDLEADSLDAVELVMAVEEKLGIEIDDETAVTLKTVKDIVDYVASKQ
ncbi:acyl carrier protein [Tannockella kyphosi]|uniref:acyl carrier protein n=1 Tax=Tannockella kyphosi TaxID=2899121 RepID=UPI0020122DAD|nr:acyl carrier protein [Tannockella kyphosi]